MKEKIISFVKRYIGVGGYKKNIIIMVGGRVIAQIIPILLTPLLTRLYSPEEFGVFGVYATIVSIVGMISNGRYCLAILLPKDKEKAKKLVIVSSFLTILTTGIFWLLLLLSNENIFSLLNVEILKSFSFLMILNIMSFGLYEALFYYVLREKMYKILAFNIIIQATVQIVSRLFFGYIGYTEVGLIASCLLSYLLSYILLLAQFRIFSSEVMKGLKLFKLLKEYVQFLKYSLFADTLSMTTTFSPNVFLNNIFGNAAAGYFAMSDKVLGSPIWFVMSSVGDVFKQEAAEQYRIKGSCFLIFIKTAKSLFLLGLIPFLLIFLILPYLVPFIFGSNWAPAGVYIRILSIMYFAKFVVGPVSYVVYIVNKQKLNVQFQSMNFLSIVISFIIGLYFDNLKISLILWSLSSTLSYIIIFIISFNIAKNSKYVEEI